MMSRIPKGEYSTSYSWSYMGAVSYAAYSNTRFAKFDNGTLYWYTSSQNSNGAREQLNDGDYLYEWVAIG